MAGKKQHEQGSCRPKAESKMSEPEKEFRGKRKKQLDAWQREHPKTRRAAAQHLSAPGAKKKSGAKKSGAAKKKTTAGGRESGKKR